MVQGLDRLIKALRERMGNRQNVSLAERRAGVDNIALFGSGTILETLHQINVVGVPAALFEPEVGQPVATILYVHGGAFVAGSPTSHQVLTDNLARQTGCRVVSLAYRLAPEHPHPAAVQDLMAVFRSMMASGMAAEKLIFAGDSAGATILLLAMCKLRDAGKPLPRAAVTISPLYDLTCSSPTYAEKAAVDPFITKAGLISDIAQYLPGGAAEIAQVQSTLSDLTGLPPLLVQVGSDEVLLGDAQMLVAAMKRGGGQAVLEVWPGMPHVWHLFPAYVAEAEVAVAAIARFIGHSGDHKNGKK